MVSTVGFAIFTTERYRKQLDIVTMTEEPFHGATPRSSQAYGILLPASV
jgi:hypothetical protein